MYNVDKNVIVNVNVHVITGKTIAPANVLCKCKHMYEC